MNLNVEKFKQDTHNTHALWLHNFLQTGESCSQRSEAGILKFNFIYPSQSWSNTSNTCLIFLVAWTRRAIIERNSFSSIVPFSSSIQNKLSCLKHKTLYLINFCNHLFQLFFSWYLSLHSPDYHSFSAAVKKVILKTYFSCLILEL